MKHRSEAFLMLIRTVTGIAYDKGYYGPSPTEDELGTPKPQYIEEHRNEILRALPQAVIEGMVNNMVKTMTEEQETVTPEKETKDE